MIGKSGHGNGVSLPRLIVGKRHCRVLTVGNIICRELVYSESMLIKKNYGLLYRSAEYIPLTKELEVRMSLHPWQIFPDGNRFNLLVE
ncbi:MAG: hypothetical protein HC789_08585 [Microcoleus sp. CSU_2_2]|nr:hypothetical protein [Microcoleus sp. CSU_2_2]